MKDLVALNRSARPKKERREQNVKLSEASVCEDNSCFWIGILCVVYTLISSNIKK